MSRPRHCSNCGGPEHDVRTCQQPCGHCGDPDDDGHKRLSCPQLAEEISTASGGTPAEQEAMKEQDELLIVVKCIYCKD